MEPTYVGGKTVKQTDIARVFREVRKVFPFPGYMDDKLYKYITVASLLAEQVSPKSKALSIGCGPCDLEAVLSKMGYEVTGIDDLNDQWHLMGRNRERIKNFAKHMAIELITEPAGLPRLREDYFDVVLLIDIIEHLHGSPRELLNYSISALKPGGLLLIETPNCVRLVNRLKVLVGKSNQVRADFFYWNIGDYRSHVREYTLPELKRILYYQDLTGISSKMTNTAVNELGESANSLAMKIMLAGYKLACQLSPSFKDTILIFGRKPKDWQPVNASVKNFKRFYPHIERWNLDNEPDEFLITKMVK